MTTTAHCGAVPQANAQSFVRDEERGYQLYQSNPSGNYGGWKAVAIGANHQGANNLLKQDYKEGLSLEEAKKLLMKASTLPLIPLLKYDPSFFETWGCRAARCESHSRERFGWLVVELEKHPSIIK